jgi:hypothetical protein
MTPDHPSLTRTDCITTLCSLAAQKAKVGNLLKTKGGKRRFSLAKAENLLKRSQLQEAMGNGKQPAKMTARTSPHGPRQAAKNAEDD